MFAIGGWQAALAQSNGNPNPGDPHDTIIIHVQKAESGPKGCENGGGHSLFVRHYGGVVVETLIYITMIDYVPVNDDPDNDDLADEDPVDGVDNDGDLEVDEDPIEIGGITYAIDCDGFPDNDGIGRIRLQIRDTDPRAGWVSVQDWWMRLVGTPFLQDGTATNFAFTSFAQQTESCELVDPTPLEPDSGDEYVECTYEGGEFIELASFNLADLGCVKSVKPNGKGGGGRTEFCDITEGFTVDVDGDGDGINDDDLNDCDPITGQCVDAEDQFVFSISCLDNPDTIDINEEEFCPLSRIIWDVDENETTEKATAQIFVGHTGSARVRTGKIKGNGNGGGD